MCSAYDTLVKEFQTNLASFINVSWSHLEWRRGIAGKSISRFSFSGRSNTRYMHAKPSEDYGNSRSQPDDRKQERAGVNRLGTVSEMAFLKFRKSHRLFTQFLGI